MKKSYLIIGGVVLLVVIAIYSWINTKDTAMKYDENVKEKWGNVQTAYQSRADKITALVDIVLGAAKNEKEILTKVTEARAGIVRAKEGMKSATTPDQLVKYGNSVNSALTLAVEAYPNVQSTKNYQNLQAEVTEVENTIKRERDLYNESVKVFNQYIRKTINSMILGNSYEVKKAFKADKGADKAPTDTKRLSE